MLVGGVGSGLDKPPELLVLQQGLEHGVLQDLG